MGSTAAQRVEQPRPRVGPVAFGGGQRDSQRRGRFLQRESTEVSHLYQLRLVGFDGGKLRQRLVDRQHIVEARRRDLAIGVDVDAYTIASVLGTPPPPRVLDQ